MRLDYWSLDSLDPPSWLRRKNAVPRHLLVPRNDPVLGSIRCLAGPLVSLGYQRKMEKPPWMGMAKLNLLSPGHLVFLEYQPILPLVLPWSDRRRLAVGCKDCWSSERRRELTREWERGQVASCRPSTCRPNFALYPLSAHSQSTYFSNGPPSPHSQYQCSIIISWWSRNSANARGAGICIRT